MDSERILDEHAEHQGWTVPTCLDLALRYIEAQGSNDAWQDFLTEIADSENGEGDYEAIDLTTTDVCRHCGRGIRMEDGGWSLPGRRSSTWRTATGCGASPARTMTRSPPSTEPTESTEPTT